MGEGVNGAGPGGMASVWLVFIATEPMSNL